MTILRSEGAGDPDSGIYSGVVQNSLRMNGSDATLTRTLVNSSDGSRRKNVWSFWVKFGYDSSANPYFYSKGENVAYADTMVIAITSNQRLQVQGYVDDGQTHNVITHRKFRDPTAWYHIVVAVDTTQATASNRIQIYVNGDLETEIDTTSYPGENADLAMNWYVGSSTVEIIGDYYAAQNAAYRINGCLAEYHSVDGLSFFSDTSGTANSSFNINSFGERKKGIWIPVAYTGAHGTQGYHLKFDNESVGSGSSSTVGADSAGSNHWTSNNILASDCNNFDCPENNVCVMNAMDRRYGNSANQVMTYTNGLLLTTTQSAGIEVHAFGTHTINEVASQGGVYFEFRVVSIDASRNYLGLVATSSFVNNSASGATIASYGFPRKAMLQLGGMYFLHTTNTVGASDDIRTGNTVFGAGEVGGMAILSDGKVFMHREGTYLKDTSGNVGNPSTGANPLVTIDLTNFKWQPYFGYAGSATHFNFGQDPTFDGNETAPDPVKRDANGIGKFLFDVPTNCLALSSSNMADPAIIEPKKHFDVLKYVGNSANDSSGSTQSITGLDFKPDWIWIKNRDTTADHRTVDSARGVQKTLYISGEDYENEGSDGTDGITAFTAASSSGAGGFVVGQHTGFNKNTDDFVAWCWKANGGVATLTNDASATSVGNLDSVCQANTDAGFSIVTYAGQNAATTVAHGLGKKPDLVIVKNRTDASTDWIVGHHELASDAFDNNKFLKLNVSNAQFSNSLVFGTTPTTTEIALTTGTAANLTAVDKNYVMYCFAEIDGFSKIGGYNAGNNQGGSTPDNDGVFIFTGFRPAWFMVKTTGSGSWSIHDSTRSPINPMQNFLLPESTVVEQTSEAIEFLSNGVKMRSASGYFDNPAGGDFIYMAFAEQPFKYANAR